MINFFDETELEQNNLRLEPYGDGNSVWFLYLNDTASEEPIRVIKKIPEENMLMYRQLQEAANKNLASVYNVAKIGNDCYAELEFVTGVSLGDYMDAFAASGQTVPFETCLDIAEQLCHGVETFHLLGLVHRDISASNVIIDLISSPVTVKLIDFDNSHQIRREAMRDTSMIGTIGYAAPEQFGFAPTEPSTDFYAIGVLMCEMITGKVNVAAAEQIESDQLRYVITRCMRMDKTERYRSAGELRNDLQSVRKGYQRSGIYRWEELLERMVDSGSVRRAASIFMKAMREMLDFEHIILSEPDAFRKRVGYWYLVAIGLKRWIRTISLVIAMLFASWNALLAFALTFLTLHMVTGRSVRSWVSDIWFYYPYTQSFDSLGDSLILTITRSDLKYQVERTKDGIRISDRKASYHIIVRPGEHRFQIRSESLRGFETFRTVENMIDMYGKLAYLVQHMDR